MDKQLPRLPLGISDFLVLREEGPNYLYVDKTERILDLLNAGKYLFLARPRRFGKSLLCSTLKYLYKARPFACYFAFLVRLIATAPTFSIFRNSDPALCLNDDL